MAIDAKKVLVGAPNQSSTVGAVQYAATTATLPTDASTAWAAGTSCGYVSEDGLTINASYNTTDIKDWSKSTVRTLLDEFTGEVSFSFIQTDYESLCALFGPSNVTKTDATQSAGEKIVVKIGAHMAPANAYVFNMKDGDTKIRIVLPNAQPVLDGDLTFVAGEAINWSVRLSCGSDTSGESIYLYVDEPLATTTTGA